MKISANKIIAFLYSITQRIGRKLKISKDSFPIRLENQMQIFEDLGLPSNREHILSKLNASLIACNLPPYDEDNGMYSEHLVILAAVSLMNSFKPKNILEIGTHDGRASCAIASLFSGSSITTVDLKDDDPIFISSYSRSDSNMRHEFTKTRNERLAMQPNIKFIQTNSLRLTTDFRSKYDLIWVDGAHGYPVVCSDITNSIRLLEDNGILMCDDVWMESAQSDEMYKSIATWETLHHFETAGIINCKLLSKRLGSRHLMSKKYVSYSTLRCA